MEKPLDANHPLNRRDGKLSAYLSKRFSRPLRVDSVSLLGEGVHGTAYKITTKEGSSFILKRFKEGGRNLQFPEDRHREAFLAKRTHNLIPHHVKAHDLVTVTPQGLETAHIQDLFLVLQEAKGLDYSHNLTTIADKKELSPEDYEHLTTIVKSLCDIHSIRGEPSYYRRYLQDWYGNGILDLLNEMRQFYPQQTIKKLKQQFLEIEHTLSSRSERCRVIHGEFFPGTIRFDGSHIQLYDSRRFGYGEPADDYGSFVVNLAITSLLHYGTIKEPFITMINHTITTYQSTMNDPDLEWIILPFMAYRALIVANPAIVPLKPSDSARMMRLSTFLLSQKRFNIKKLQTFR